MSIMNNLVLKTAWGLTEPLLWTVDGIHRPLVGFLGFLMAQVYGHFSWGTWWWTMNFVFFHSRWFFPAGKAQFGFPPNRNAPTSQMLVNQYFQLISMYINIHIYIYLYIIYILTYRKWTRYDMNFCWWNSSYFPHWECQWINIRLRVDSWRGHNSVNR